jgi:methionyl-tRNA synthetase
MPSFYITTAIDYVNGSPHLGHAYEKVLTDVIARFRRLMGDQVHFLTGVDEHGQKVQAERQRSAASRRSNSCRRRERRVPGPAAQAQHIERRLHPHHRAAAQNRSCAPGAPATVRQRRDLPGRVPGVLQHPPGAVSPGERSAMPDGSWPEIFGEVTEITESNYFFKLQPVPGLAPCSSYERHPHFRFPRVPPETGARVSQGAAQRPLHLAAQANGWSGASRCRLTRGMSPTSGLMRC